ncbi:MAG: polysaccharide pyruvyl transferase family protein [Oscillospiraceae bacterium]
MKKIGMMTFHASHNNGSMLQALALQNILEKKYNCFVEIINFSNPSQQNLYSPIPKPSNWKQLIKSIIWFSNYKQLKKQYMSYEKFSKLYLHTTEKRYSNNDELQGIEDNYDALIVGSDQVWNTNCIDVDDVYFFDFVNYKPRYAYAVSFGANNPFELDNGSGVHVGYFRKFNKVSVRETNAQKWTEEATGVTVPICLDPTMLYDKEEWEKIVDVGDKPVIPGKYIFYYCFSITEDVQKFLKYVTKKTGLPVYFMEAKEWTLKSCWRNKIKLIKQYGPDVYINVVKHAEIFITTSFHGTAFATIYRKRFWYIKSKESESSKDDRAISFLTQLNLTPRYKTIPQLMEMNLFDLPDYTNIDQQIQILRKQSFEYLNSIIAEI